MRTIIQAFVIAASVFGVAVHAQPVTEKAKTESIQAKESKLNINVADAKTIAKGLKGIGIKKAEAIVAYRTQNGAFKSATDLMKVKGIGAATVQKNAGLIAFN